jgi:hypothetical protein
MPRFRKNQTSNHEFHEGDNRFEHWYRDNKIYIITARVRDKKPAFESLEAQQVFWNQWSKYTKEFEYTSWITSLLNNHYHDLGYNRYGDNLPKMMQRIHGSIAKLVNDLLDVRIVPFWIDSGKQNYLDGCVRDVPQAQRAFRYTYFQCTRHRVCSHPTLYPNTRVNVELNVAIQRADQLAAFLWDVPYERYERHRRKRGRAG